MENVKLQESSTNEQQFAGFWIRLCAQIVDGLVLIPILILYMTVLKDYINENFIAYLIYYLLLYSSMVFFIMRFGGTPGKLIVGLRIIGDRKSIGFDQVMLRNSIYLISLVPFIMLKYFSLNNSLKSVLGTVDSLLGLVFIIDVLFIPFNRKKRALHDFIAKTYVVFKSKNELPESK